MADSKSDNLPPHIQLIQMGRAHVVARTVYAAAKLGLTDQLASGPKSAGELAGPMHVHAPSLHRLMRTLASMGILTERTEQRFALTDLGKALKTGAMVDNPRTRKSGKRLDKPRKTSGDWPGNTRSIPPAVRWKVRSPRSGGMAAARCWKRLPSS